MRQHCDPNYQLKDPDLRSGTIDDLFQGKDVGIPQEGSLYTDQWGNPIRFAYDIRESVTILWFHSEGERGKDSSDDIAIAIDLDQGKIMTD